MPTKEAYIEECQREIDGASTSYKMLLEYIKDPHTNKKIGVVVAYRSLKRGICLGWSKCNPRDKFNKQIGISLAICTGIPQRYLDDKHPRHPYNTLKSLQLVTLVNAKVEHMRDRARRYFKL